MGLEQAQRVPLSETVAEQLRDALRAGDYPAGSKLPTEAELSRTLGVGRTTVREAVRTLVSDGMLVSRQGSGVYATGRLSLVQRLTSAELIEIFHTRCAIETYASGLACEHRTDAEIIGLEEALTYRDQAAPRTREFAERDIAFHRAVVAAAHNSILLEMFQTLEPRLVDAFVDSRFTERAEPDRAAAHAEGHHQLIDAIRRRDIDQATRVATLLQAGAISVLEQTDTL